MSDDIVVGPTRPEIVATLKSKLVASLAEWTAGLTKLTKEEAPQVYQMAEQVKKLGEEVKDRARDLLVDEALSGEKVTDKGTMQTTLGGSVVRAIPLKTGTDPTKLEQLLRAKGVDPGVAMDATISYKLNQEKLLVAVGAGVLTSAELAKCAYEPNYRVEVRRG